VSPHGKPSGPEAKRALKASLRDAWVEVPRTLRLAFRFARSGIIALGLLTFAGAFVPLAMAYAGKRIVDAIVQGDRVLVVRWVMIELIFASLFALTQRLSAMVRSSVGARLGVDINLIILEKAQEIPLSHFEDPEFYDRLTRARREASSRPLSVVTGLFALVQHTLTLVGYGAILLQVNAWAVLALVVAAVPSMIAELRFSASAFRIRNFRAPDTRRLSYLEFLLGNEGNAKEMMVFGLGKTFLNRYRTLAEQMYQEDQKLAVRRSIWGYLLSLLAVAVFYAFYASVAVKTATAAFTIGSLTLYIASFRQGQQAFQSLLSTVGGMFEDNLYMSNLFAYLGADHEGAGGKALQGPAPETSAAAATMKDMKGTPTLATEAGLASAQARALGIEFCEVGFRYPGKEAWALRHINLKIAPGERIALVGDNGSGKTTLIKLLTRLYEPTEGRILLDGQDIRELPGPALRNRIGVIFQDFVRYQLSLTENVAVGSIADADKPARITQALELGGAADIAATLAQGTETQLGRWFSREGTELSGGQWQRIALARAFMREQADILILDEPTSALDAEAEQAIFDRFQRLSAGKTTFLISHRFSTVRTANRIVVLRDGGVVEQGSHAELLAKGGRYSELFKLQAKGYL
jgi:ATP-binding cassette, subfamily B, bacterial